MQTETTAASTTLRAFHGDPTIKAKYLARVEGHMAADELVKGATGEEGKGCAVWCTLDAYQHSRYPVELGIPEWLARVEDTLFEGMTLAKSKTWPRDFLQACATGADLETAKAPFMVVVLRSTLANFDHDKFPQVLAAVNGTIALWSRDDIGSEDWSAARSAARSAAESAARSAARSAAGSAAWSAAGSAAGSAARSAARSAAGSAAWSAAGSAAGSAAESAAWSAAESAAWSAAWSAAGSAAGSAAYDKFADALLAILRDITLAAQAPSP